MIYNLNVMKTNLIKHYTCYSLSFCVTQSQPFNKQIIFHDIKQGEKIIRVLNNSHRNMALLIFQHLKTCTFTAIIQKFLLTVLRIVFNFFYFVNS